MLSSLSRPADSETTKVSDLGSSGSSAFLRPGAGFTPTLWHLPSRPRVLPLPVQHAQMVVGISPCCKPLIPMVFTHAPITLFIEPSFAPVTPTVELPFFTLLSLQSANHRASLLFCCVHCQEAPCFGASFGVHRVPLMRYPQACIPLLPL